MLLVDHTVDGTLSNKLARELAQLRENASDVVDQSLFARSERKFGAILKLATHSIRNML